MIKFLSSQWLGLEDLGRKELEKMRPTAERAVEKAGRHFMNEVKKTLSGERSGKVYPVGRRGRVYQASAPGEPPASRSGALRRSITMTEPRWVGWNVSVDVGSALDYARRMEYGGVSTVPHDVTVQVAPGVWRRVKAGTLIRIRARPYFATTYAREAARIDQILEEAVRADR